jgi:hypothetical protein
MALEMTVENMLPAFMLGVGLLFIVLLGLLFYVYTSLAMMFTAMRLKTKNAWLAWIPIANLVLMANMAKRHWWPVLLLIAVFIPFINFIAILLLVVFTIIWLWAICERRSLPGWLALLTLIPWLGNLWMLILWGILAWGGGKTKNVSAPAKKAPAKKAPAKKAPAKKASIKKKPAKTAKKKVATKKKK